MLSIFQDIFSGEDAHVREEVLMIELSKKYLMVDIYNTEVACEGIHYRLFYPSIILDLTTKAPLHSLWVLRGIVIVE